MRQRIRQSHVVQAEKEAQICRGNLQKRNFVLLSFAKGGTGLGINPQFRMTTEVLHRTLRFLFALNDDDSPLKGVAGQGGDEFFVRFDEEFLHKS